MKLSAMVKKPAAFLPVIMSIVAMSMVFVYAGKFGVPHETDEGTPAHIWQLLMAAQIPIMMFFALRWLPQAPKQALIVLALQCFAMLAALAPVLLLGL
jgi:hypothetical protein